MIVVAGADTTAGKAYTYWNNRKKMETRHCVLNDKRALDLPVSGTFAAAGFASHGYDRDDTIYYFEL